MSDFRPMNECKGFNMERVLLKNKNGYMITAYFKDGMLQCDGDEDWTQPIAWSGFIRLRDLANGASDEPQTDTCNIPHVVGRSELLPKRLSNQAYKKAKTLRYEEFVEWWDSRV